MSFRVKNGNLFANVTEGYILHGCNAQGVMGSGVAKIIREMYPLAYMQYKQWHDEFGLALGDIITVKVTPDLVILNGVTQHLFGRDGGPYINYPALQFVLDASLKVVNREVVSCSELHMPLIGGGLGGGDKGLIIEMMQDTFEAVNTDVTLWLYNDEQSH
jgi:O-acetyl-ADP-ribose deacetylase (regulator of RNase III)